MNDTAQEETKLMPKTKTSSEMKKDHVANKVCDMEELYETEDLLAELGDQVSRGFSLDQ